MEAGSCSGLPTSTGADGEARPPPPGHQKERTPLFRRASCREAGAERSPAFERSGSLRALPNQPTRPIRRGSLLTSALGEAGAGREGGASPTAPPSPRPDRGLFLNLTGALFGEGKLQQVLSPTRTGDTFFSKTTPLSRAPSEKGRRKGSATPSQLGEDLFTQFSQYGSRAHLCQPETEPSSVRKLSSEQPRHPEQRRHRKPEGKVRCRSREKSCEAVVIRVTDTEVEQDVPEPAQAPLKHVPLPKPAPSSAEPPSVIPSPAPPAACIEPPAVRQSIKLPEAGRWVRRKAPQMPRLQLGGGGEGRVKVVEPGRGVSARSDSDSG